MMGKTGIGNAIKTLSKEGPFPLEGFRKVVEST